MSIATITAARIYQGQLQNKTGEENKLFFEKFPYTGLSKVYLFIQNKGSRICKPTKYNKQKQTNANEMGSHKYMFVLLDSTTKVSK